MIPRYIREQQSKNASNVIQVRFPKPTKPSFIKYTSTREADRRKRQIANGSLKAENGLAV